MTTSGIVILSAAKNLPRQILRRALLHHLEDLQETPGRKGLWGGSRRNAGSRAGYHDGNGFG